MLIIICHRGFPFRNFIVYAPNYCGILLAADLRYAAEQPRPLTAGRDTAPNRHSFSSDIIIIIIIPMTMFIVLSS